MLLLIECCARKYPGAPVTSYEQARKSANQYGLEQKQLFEGEPENSRTGGVPELDEEGDE